MASPIYIRIYNYTRTNITTSDTEHHDLEDDGANFNNKTINAGSALESDTRVKTGAGNGELTITFYEGTAMVGYIKMKDLKNPHKGLDSTEVPMPVNTSSPQFTYVAYRHLDSEPEEERYTYVAINTYPTSSTLP